MSLDQIIPKVLEKCRCKENTVGAILGMNPDLFLKFGTGIYGLKRWVSNEVESL
jgi:capsid portal protein